MFPGCTACGAGQGRPHQVDRDHHLLHPGGLAHLPQLSRLDGLHRSGSGFPRRSCCHYRGQTGQQGKVEMVLKEMNILNM